MVWNVDPEMFQLGPLTIRWYGFFFAMGFVIGFHIEKWIFRREGVDVRKLDNLLTLLVLGTIIGARLGHCLLYEPEIYLRDPVRILKVWEGGLASHGGVVGVVIAIYVAVRILKLPSFLWTLDRIAVPTALASALIRIGNFFNSEILGHPTQIPWAIQFAKVDMIPRHPAQLYESFCNLICFFVLLSLYKKEKYRNAPGFLTGVLLVFIFTMRFFIEFFKENQVDFEASMTFDMGQLLSIPVVLVGLGLIYRSLALTSSRQLNSAN
jgi:prolipoprotein diacylglyceryl transferase